MYVRTSVLQYNCIKVAFAKLLSFLRVLKANIGADVI